MINDWAMFDLQIYITLQRSVWIISAGTTPMTMTTDSPTFISNEIQCKE